MDDEDLSIPHFLRATGPGRPCEFTADIIDPDRPCGYGPSCWEEINRPDRVEAQELKDAIKAYKCQKRFALFQQWAYENPELVAMNRRAKHAALRHIAKLGIAPANRRRR